jgi:hypothetical protein
MALVTEGLFELLERRIARRARPAGGEDVGPASMPADELALAAP